MRPFGPPPADEVGTGGGGAGDGRRKSAAPPARISFRCPPPRLGTGLGRRHPHALIYVASVSAGRLSPNIFPPQAARRLEACCSAALPLSRSSLVLRKWGRCPAIVSKYNSGEANEESVTTLSTLALAPGPQAAAKTAANKAAPRISREACRAPASQPACRYPSRSFVRSFRPFRRRSRRGRGPYEPNAAAAGWHEHWVPASAQRRDELRSAKAWAVLKRERDDTRKNGTAHASGVTSPRHPGPTSRRDVSRAHED